MKNENIAVINLLNGVQASQHKLPESKMELAKDKGGKLVQSHIPQLIQAKYQQKIGPTTSLMPESTSGDKGQTYAEDLVPEEKNSKGPHAASDVSHFNVKANIPLIA